jgi:hypothetical protein
MLAESGILSAPGTRWGVRGTEDAVTAFLLVGGGALGGLPVDAGFLRDEADVGVSDDSDRRLPNPTGYPLVRGLSESLSSLRSTVSGCGVTSSSSDSSSLETSSMISVKVRGSSLDFWAPRVRLAGGCRAAGDSDGVD